METVELILVKSDLSNNIGWSLEEPRGNEQELDRKAFIIPEGFKLAETTAGEIAFFDEEGRYSEIYTNQKTKTPFLWNADGRNYFQTADLVCSKVKDLRRAAGLTQRELAEYFEIPKRTLEKWETGESEPTEYLVKLMEYKLRKEGILK